MFDRPKKGYQKLVDYDLDAVQSSGAMVSYQIPSGLGSYTKRGLEYQDIEGNNVTITPEKIPDFLHSICEAEIPWTQWTFAALFYDADQQPMPGIVLLEEALNANPAALMDYRLMMIGARAAQIQVATVGSERHQMLCAESKSLLQLYKKLRDEFQYFQKQISSLEQNQSASRHRSKAYAQLERSFKECLDRLTQPYLEKYKSDWDTRNLFLNVVAIASVVGLIRLIYKNLERFYHGKNPSLFQFDAAYSKNIDVIEQLSSPTLGQLSIDLQNFFTQNRDYTIKTIGELKQVLQALNKEITAFATRGSSRDIKELQNFHQELAKDLDGFESEIQASQHTEQEEATREVAEAVFISNWCETVQMTFGQYKRTQAYPIDLQKVLDDIHTITEQLSDEFHSSDRFKLYSYKRF